LLLNGYAWIPDASVQVHPPIITQPERRGKTAGLRFPDDLAMETGRAGALGDGRGCDRAGRGLLRGIFLAFSETSHQFGGGGSSDALVLAEIEQMMISRC